MPSMPQRRYTVPIFVFFSLCGFYFIVIQMTLSHAPERFLEVHEASKVPMSPTNNMIPLLDNILTPLISFFVSAFGNTSSSAYPTVTNFVWSFGAAIQLPLVEAQRVDVNGSRGKRNLAARLLSYPMIWGILYQRLSGGWILPLWLLAFMHARTRDEGAGMERIKAESVLAGWWIGHTLPALAMLIPGQPALSSTPVWVAFPILMTLAQRGYLFIRKQFTVSDRMSSGYITLQLTYLSAFIGSCIAQINLVIIPGLYAASASVPTRWVLLDKLIGLTRYLYTFFIPETGFRIPSPQETTAVSGVLHFVQFDILIVFPAMWTAILWDLALRRREWLEAAGRSASGAGSCRWAAPATSGLLMYREAQLKKVRHAGVTGPSVDEENREKLQIRRCTSA
ncbi:hypothetical protein DFH11DRAFT_1566430 [Phellopilus nigrolimitatus]|nr:hypothetical protein DFH11DRAFT_1566430 [Phellopilus nigrolimitatus]